MRIIIQCDILTNRCEAPGLRQNLRQNTGCGNVGHQTVMAVGTGGAVRAHLGNDSYLHISFLHDPRIRQRRHRIFAGVGIGMGPDHIGLGIQFMEPLHQLHHFLLVSGLIKSVSGSIIAADIEDDSEDENITLEEVFLTLTGKKLRDYAE